MPASQSSKTHALATQACHLCLDSVSELMSLMIHDLANPVQSLMMQLELGGDPSAPGQGLDIDALLHTGEEIGSLLNRLSTFFYRRDDSAPCQLRASLARLQDTMQQRLANRGILWKSSWLEIPELPHDCMIPELVLLRCLILIGYQPRQDLGQTLSLRSTALLTSHFCEQSPVDLRIHLELSDQRGASAPIFRPEKAKALQDQLRGLGPGFSLSILIHDRVQLDFRLPCPPSR